MKYEPKPIDTAGVTLSADVLKLTEQLAENTHEVWAKTRIEQGWTFGPVRDDANKRHPCLVPYSELPESERVFDRNTAMETLKAVVALGYIVARG